jgi:hypothetical protein
MIAVRGLFWKCSDFFPVKIISEKMCAVSVYVTNLYLSFHLFVSNCLLILLEKRFVHTQIKFV